MTKQDFIAECNRQMANITDPKRRAANMCVANKKSWTARRTRAVIKRKIAEQKAKKDAKSKL